MASPEFSVLKKTMQSHIFICSREDSLRCFFISKHKPKSMKQFLFAMAAMAVISCNDTKVAGSNDASGKNAENMKAVYHAFETGDVSKIGDIMADDVTDHNANPDNSDVKGRDSVLKMISQFHTYFDNLKMEPMHDATSPDGVYHYTTVRFTGKAKANPLGIPEGTDMDDQIVDVVKFKDGKATDHWGYLSWNDFNEIMMAHQPMTDTSGKKMK
jgi:ketosteroid isomerase-like protein